MVRDSIPGSFSQRGAGSEAWLVAFGPLTDGFDRLWWAQGRHDAGRGNRDAPMVLELGQVVLELAHDPVRRLDPEHGVGAADEALVRTGGSPVGPGGIAQRGCGKGLERIYRQLGQIWEQELEVATHV